MTSVEAHGLSIDKRLYDFIVTQAIPGTHVEADAFFAGFSRIVHDLAPKNRALLAKRDDLQAQIDAWYRENGAPVDLKAYGLIPELVGRLPIVTFMHALDRDTLRRILTEPKNALVKQDGQQLAMNGVKLRVTRDALRALADDGKLPLGVRVGTAQAPSASGSASRRIASRLTASLRGRARRPRKTPRSTTPCSPRSGPR